MIGPSHILWKENATTVFISCPFLGEHSPVWATNGQLYSLLDVPAQYKPCTYGLLIPLVMKEINGTTFQCIVPTKQKEISLLSSSVGMLFVSTIY